MRPSDVVFDALAEPKAISELIAATGLTAKQVTNAVQRLRTVGRIARASPSPQQRAAGVYNFMIDSDGDLALCHRESGSDPVWIDGKEARRLRDFLNRAEEMLAA